MTSSIARLNASSFAREGFVEPLNLRTNCSAEARISSSGCGRFEIGDAFDVPAHAGSPIKLLRVVFKENGEGASKGGECEHALPFTVLGSRLDGPLAMMCACAAADSRRRDPGRDDQSDVRPRLSRPCSLMPTYNSVLPRTNSVRPRFGSVASQIGAQIQHAPTTMRSRLATSSARLNGRPSTVHGLMAESARAVRAFIESDALSALVMPRAPGSPV